MNKIEFMEGIHILQDNYNKKLSTEQLKLFYENLRDMEKDEFIKNIKGHIKTSQYMPNIAQIREGISGRKMSNFSNCNLNSSYWYINLREWCDKNNKPYFDIETGKPLKPFKD